MDRSKNIELARVAYPDNEELRVAYMLGLEKGYELCGEDIMNNAVTGKVSGEVHHMGKKKVCVDIPYFETDCLSVGNKVKAIVIKD